MTLPEHFLQLFTLQGLISIVVLTILEIVLGIDNVIFVAIVADKLKFSLRQKAKTIGLTFALIFRILLLLLIKWLIGLTKVLVEIYHFQLTGRDLILFLGGIFLLFKTMEELLEKWGKKQEKVTGNNENAEDGHGKDAPGIYAIVAQIIFIDMVLSLDSILTAVTVATNIFAMISAIIIAMLLMLYSSTAISRFLNKHASLKTLALLFLLLVGLLLIADAIHLNTEAIKPYLYGAVLFSFGYELLKIQFQKRKH